MIMFIYKAIYHGGMVNLMAIFKLYHIFGQL